MLRTMTSRERIIAAVRREPVDHIPCCGFFNPLTPTQRRGHTWNFPWAADASPRDQLAYQVGHLGLDQIVHIGVSVTRQAEGVTSRVWRDGDILHKSYQTPAGILHAAVRCNELWPHGMDIPFYSDFNIGHFIEPWIQSREDLDCLRQLQIRRDADEAIDLARRTMQPAAALAATFKLATMANAGSGLTGAQHLFGGADLCMLTLDDPELVDAYLEHEHLINLRLIEVIGALGIDIVSRNGFYETADFYGPEMLQHFLGRRLTAEAEAVHRAGMVVSYTVHTGVTPILDYLAALPVDSLRGIDIAFKGVDPAEINRILAPSKAFWVGPSSTFHIWKGPEPTRQAVRQTFEVFGRTGLILSQCVSSHSIMPWESSVAMIDEWRRLR